MVSTTTSISVLDRRCDAGPNAGRFHESRSGKG